MIDPATSSTTGAAVSQSTTARKQLSEDYSNFLRLLTTQLKNQDPTDPTDTNQLTQQIATLSQVEQQINTNKNLEKLIGMFLTTQYNSVVSYIGKQVEAIGTATELRDGQAPFAYYLAQDAATVKLTIKDSTGLTVYSGDGPMAKGRNQFVWDGKSSGGNDMPNGIYTIEVEAKDGSGNPVTKQTYTTGIVTSIDSVDGTIYLSLGELSIPITNVISVRQPSLPEGA